MLPLDVVAGSSNLGYESFSLALERLRDKVNLILFLSVFFLEYFLSVFFYKVLIQKNSG